MNRERAAERAYAICKAIANGEPLRRLLQVEGISWSSWYDVCEAEPSIGERYARAREMRLGILVEEILEISDASNLDTKLVEGKIVVDGETVNRARLRVDARKGLLSKLMPKVYGDKITTEHRGIDGKPIEIVTKAQRDAAVAAALRADD